MPKIIIPPPKRRGPKPKCTCGICPSCLNRIRVLRKYYSNKPEKVETVDSHKEFRDEQLRG